MKGGFSLIEILIAISLLSMMMIGVIEVTSNSTQTRDDVINEDNEFLMAETSLSILEWDFSHIYSPMYFAKKFAMNINDSTNAELYSFIMMPFQQNPNFSGPAANFMPIPLFESPDKATFKFMTASHRRVREAEKSSNFTWVIYKLVGEQLIRYSFPNDPFGNKEYKADDKGRPQILLERVRKFQVTYWDPVTNAFQENLNVVKDGQGIIRAIKINIEIMDSEGNVARQVSKISRPLWPLIQIIQTTSNSVAPTTGNGTNQNQNQNNNNFNNGMGGF